MNKLCLYTLISLLSIVNSFGKGTTLEFSATQWPDTFIILGYYYEGKVLVADSVFTDKKGSGVLNVDSTLESGIYTVYFPNKSNFDILLDNPSKVSIEIDGDNYVNDTKIKGSSSSASFLEYQRFMSQMQVRRKAIVEGYKRSKSNEDSVSFYKAQLELLDNDVSAKWDELTDNNEEGYLSFFINSLKPISAPDSLSVKNEAIQKQRYNYLTENHFNNLPLNDKRSIRTPQIGQKIDEYLTKFILQIPDSVVAEGNWLVKQSIGDDEMFKFVTQKVLNFANTSEMMGLDRLFNDIAKQYYFTGKATWADSTLLSKITKRVAYTQNNLIGSKAKEIVLQSPSDEFFSLHETEAPYTIVYFWEPGCSHCKKVTPELNSKIYQRFKDQGLKIFAVYTQDDKEEWEKFINEKELYGWVHVYDPYHHSNFRVDYNVTSTPQLYILDRDKTILAKKIGVDTAALILERLFKTGKIY